MNATLLQRQGDRFVWTGGYDTRMVPKEAGFRWDPVGKRWWTTDAERAARLITYADDTTRAALSATAERRETALAASRAQDSDAAIPVPAGLDYLPFQKAGIAYGMSRNALLLGDEMGLGKTIQFLGLVNADSHARRVLLICPAHLRVNWEREAKKWLVRPTTVLLADARNWPAADLAAATGDVFVICHYEAIVRHATLARETQWDLLGADEAHYLKTPTSQRTVAVCGRDAGRGKEAVAPIPTRRPVLMTGSPILNGRPVELYPLLKYLGWPDTFFTFAKRYCGAHQETIRVRGGALRTVWNFQGATNLAELQDKLRSTIMVRRLAVDVLKDLPPLRRQVIVLPTNGLAPFVEAERKAYEADAAARLAPYRQAVEDAEKAGDNEAYKAAVEALESRAERFGSAGELARARHELALAKVPQVVTHVEMLLEERPKVAVFVHHRSVGQGIWRRLNGLPSGSDVREVDGDRPSATAGEATPGVDVPMPVRRHEAGSEVQPEGGDLDRLSGLSAEEARALLHASVSDADTGAEAGEGSESSLQPRAGGHRRAGAVSSARDSAGVQQSARASEQPVAGSDRAGEGLRAGQRVGGELAGEPHQGRRDAGRAGAGRGSVAGTLAVLATGDQSVAERQAAIDRFQTDPSCRVIVASIYGAGTGFTMTAADMVVFAELDWVPGSIAQAEKRCHRIGQTRSVLVQHLVVDGSIDARLAAVIVRKQDIADRVLDVEPAPLPVLPPPAPEPTNNHAPLPDVPEGYYAVPSRTGNNDLDFYRVDRPTEGKWAGKTFVKRILGGHDPMRLSFGETRLALEQIVAAGIEEAMKAYGQNLGLCGRCNRELTDQTSRELGIGPTCLARLGG